MIYILTIVVDAIIHGWFSFVHTCVLMGYLDNKSYCLVGKEDIVCYFLFLVGATNVNVMSQRQNPWKAYQVWE